MATSAAGVTKWWSSRFAATRTTPKAKAPLTAYQGLTRTWPGSTLALKKRQIARTLTTASGTLSRSVVTYDQSETFANHRGIPQTAKRTVRAAKASNTDWTASCLWLRRQRAKWTQASNGRAFRKELAATTLSNFFG